MPSRNRIPDMESHLQSTHPQWSTPSWRPKHMSFAVCDRTHAGSSPVEGTSSLFPSGSTLIPGQEHLIWFPYPEQPSFGIWRLANGTNPPSTTLGRINQATRRANFSQPSSRTAGPSGWLRDTLGALFTPGSSYLTFQRDPGMLLSTNRRRHLHIIWIP